MALGPPSINQARNIGSRMNSTTPAVSLLLATAYRHIIHEPNIETAHDRFVAISGSTVSYEAFCDAVAACLRDGLIREPIRLPEGALQCHWHLELTPAGIQAARAALQNG